MKSSLIATVLLVAVALAAAAKNPSFDAYLKKYNKSYSSAEYETRHAIFLKHVKEVAKHRAAQIAKGEDAWMGVTEFSDMTREEFLNSGRVMKKKLQAKDARSCLANGVEADYSDIDLSATPTEFSWLSKKDVISPVQNQQQCGSCWTFSTVMAIESAFAIKNKKLTKLSEQEIVDCSTACVLEAGQQVCNGGCNGGWPWAALSDVIAWGGLDSEKDYPYTAETDTCKKKGKVFDKVVNYTCLSGPKYADEELMAAFLVKNGPLSIAMDAGLLQSYNSGILDPSDGACSTTSLDHAINIVGFGETAKGKNGTAAQKYWIIRNSWGPTWGEKGYFRIVRGKGACGLNAGVVFPIVA